MAQSIKLGTKKIRLQLLLAPVQSWGTGFWWQWSLQSTPCLPRRQLNGSDSEAPFWTFVQGPRIAEFTHAASSARGNKLANLNKTAV